MNRAAWEQRGNGVVTSFSRRNVHRVNIAADTLPVIPVPSADEVQI
jgi:hypothetical protein